MGHRGWTSALVLSLAVGCAESAPLPSVGPPRQNVAEIPGQGDFARGSFRAPLSVEDAEQILLHTRVFEVGGMPPKRQVQAFNVLLDQPDARARFESIAIHAETAGKLYALCALLQLNPEPATALASDLANGGATLLVWDWDVGGSKPAAELVVLIRKRPLGGNAAAEGRDDEVL